MSKVTKRKHVMKEMQTDDFDPPTSNQQIVRIVSSRGNNLHEVESAISITTNQIESNNDDDNGCDTANRFLVSMPTKFRKNVWVKRGDYVIVESIDEGDKVKAEIVRILSAQHIKEFKKDGIWPEKFTVKRDDLLKSTGDNHSDDSDDDLIRNTNRAQQNIESDVESDDDSDEDSSTDDE